MNNRHNSCSFIRWGRGRGRGRGRGITIPVHGSGRVAQMADEEGLGNIVLIVGMMSEGRKVDAGRLEPNSGVSNI